MLQVVENLFIEFFILMKKLLLKIWNIPIHTKGKITKDKIEEIGNITSRLKPNNIETDIILDSWRIELIINGITYYNKTKVTKETLPKDIRQLLYILIKNSTVDIDLYDFA